MARNWDAEWSVLSKAKRAAFKKRNEARAAMTSVFARYGALNAELIDTANAEVRWKAAKAECDRFIAEYRHAI